MILLGLDDELFITMGFEAGEAAGAIGSACMRFEVDASSMELSDPCNE